MTPREALIAYWAKRHRGMLERSKPLIWERWLDRPRVLADNICFTVGASLLTVFVDLVIVNEDELAASVIDTAECYFRTAIERDDLSSYAMTGQEELGRAERLRLLTMARWFKERTLDQAAFRKSVDMKQGWNEHIFSLKEWRSTGFSLSEWIAEKIILEQFKEAMRLHLAYGGVGSSTGGSPQGPEGVLAMVAGSLDRPEDAKAANEAERHLDKFYRSITNWGAPAFREAEMLHEERFLYAYVRGKYFKGQGDPIQVIKRMKFSD